MNIARTCCSSISNSIEDRRTSTTPAYRSRLFSVASNNNVEVICLNWAANVLLEESANLWNAIAGSAWYIAPRGVTPTDADVNRLHRGGMYYSIVGERWHSFYLNYEPHSVLLRKQPVFAAGPQVLAPRITPQVVARRAWGPRSRANGRALLRTTDSIHLSNSMSHCRRCLPQLCGQDPLVVERALELLEGPEGHVSDWYTLKELSALKVADEESLRRVTVSKRRTPVRQGVAFRRRRARCAQTAATIPGQILTWPKPVADLAAGFRYRWTNDEPHSNVEPVGGGHPAALVYLGDNPETDTLANVYAKVNSARRIHASIASVQAGGRSERCGESCTGSTVRRLQEESHASVLSAARVRVDY